MKRKTLLHIIRVVISEKILYVALLLMPSGTYESVLLSLALSRYVDDLERMTGTKRESLNKLRITKP